MIIWFYFSAYFEAANELLISWYIITLYSLQSTQRCSGISFSYLMWTSTLRSCYWTKNCFTKSPITVVNGFWTLSNLKVSLLLRIWYKKLLDSVFIYIVFALLRMISVIILASYFTILFLFKFLLNISAALTTEFNCTN